MESKKKQDKMIKKLSLPNITLPKDNSLKKRKGVKLSNEPIPAFFTYDSDQLKREKSMKIVRDTGRMKSLSSE